jgi:penicillin-binding protein 2
MINSKKIKKIFNRYTFLILIMAILFSILGVRLYCLQVTQGQYYSDTVNTKSHKLITISAPRGFITDKNGVQLARDVQSYNIDYTDTDENEKTLFPTLKKVFQILDENGQTQTDNLELKSNPCRFEFNSSDPSVIQSMQVRFLKDRGFQESILKKKEFGGKKEDDLSDSQKAMLSAELLKLSPEYVYNELVKNYGIIEGLKSINVQATPENIRRYLLVVDGIKMNSFTGYKPVTIASNVSTDTSLIVQQSLFELPGINVDNESLRQYPYGQLGSAVLGYISKINTDDQEKYSEKGYDVSSDYIGASGIEGALESKLRGNDGGEVVQVDKQGRITNQLATREAEPGDNVQLTIDANLQYTAEQALKKEMAWMQSTKTYDNGTTDIYNATRGAVVAVDIHTGAILALVSLPGFNPNDFSNPNGLTSAQVNEYFNTDYESKAKALQIPQSQIDQRFPINTSISGNSTIREDEYDFFPKLLYNYATMSLIPPGSAFKPVTAVAGLETGAIDAGTTYDDENCFNMGGGQVDQFGDAANGKVDVKKGLQVSSNPFFMRTAQLLLQKTNNNLNILAQYAWEFGLGADQSDTNPGTGIEIPENFGQVYNTVSQKNSSAKLSVLNVEDDLTTGVSGQKTKLPKIDLYDRDGDNKIIYNGKKLSDIKNEIKNDIKDTVKNGTFSEENYKNLFKELVAADSARDGSNITSTDINNVVDDVRYRGIYAGHSLLNLPYNIYDAAIGQGMDSFTPLQIVGYFSTLANGGTRYKLHLVDKITDSTGKVVLENTPQVIDKVPMSATTQSLISQGLNSVTEAGTAADVFKGFPIPSAGKTGTAQFGTDDKQKAEGRSNYAWYVGYAPSDNPQIAVAAVIFDGGYGDLTANVVKDVYEGYFKNDPRMANYKDDIDVNAKPEN